jgi:hypothetical protein
VSPRNVRDGRRPRDPRALAMPPAPEPGSTPPSGGSTDAAPPLAPPAQRLGAASAARSRTPLVVFAVGAAVAASIVLVLLGLGAFEALRAVVGLSLVLIVPGAAATMAAFRPGSLRVEEVVLLSIGLSISLVILLGLGLASVGVSIALGPWLIGIVAVTVVSVALASRRRRATGWQPDVMRAAGSAPPVRLTALALAAVLTVAALLVARGSAYAQVYPGFAAVGMVADGSDGLRITVTNRGIPAGQLSRGPGGARWQGARRLEHR